MCNLLYGDASMEMTYKACVFKRQMLGAADIVALAASSVTGVDGRKCAVEIGDGKVTMRGVASTNTVVIPAEDTDGSICIGINSTYLKLVARLGEKIRFHGAGAQAPIHFTNNEEGMHILVLPIQLNTTEKGEEVKGTA